MKKLLLYLSCVVCSGLAIAQPVPTSNLTIFSEDGHKFYLILNGQRQNDKPETNIRLEDLEQPYYSAKIIFEDKTLAEISKNALTVRDANGEPQDVTYKIKSGKDGKQTLRYYSSLPIVPNLPPARPQGVAVYSYGQPAVPVVASTTQVTTTTTNAPSTGINISVPGININVNDPNVVHQTTTTTTTHTTQTQSPPPVVGQPVPAQAPRCAYAMSPGDFASAKGSINKSGFDETKLSSAKSIISNNCMYVNQIVEICKLFGFEETKLAFAKYAYDFCYDQKNYFKVSDVFGFDSSREELNSYITR